VFDRKLIVLLCLVTCAARADDWLLLRPHGAGNLPAILIDTSSIVVLDSGLRRATTKTDFLGSAHSENVAPNVLVSVRWIHTYDCAKRLIHEESNLATLGDGRLSRTDNSKNPKWYPRPNNPAAAPAFDFVCNSRAPPKAPSGDSGQRPDD